MFIYVFFELVVLKKGYVYVYVNINLLFLLFFVFIKFYNFLLYSQRGYTSIFQNVKQQFPLRCCQFYDIHFTFVVFSTFFNILIKYSILIKTCLYKVYVNLSYNSNRFEMCVFKIFNHFDFQWSISFNTTHHLKL